MNRVLWLLTLVSTIVALGLVACASKPPSPPKPTIVQVTIDVQPTVNPDARGRPSPIVVRMYTLKSPSSFNSAAFFSLFEKDKETLGADLVDSEEFLLMPGNKREFKKQLQPDALSVGVFAAFRDVERSQWRAVVAVPPNQLTPVNIRLDDNKVSIAVGK